jgi:hypothetical protein
MRTKVASIEEQMVALESEIYLLEWDMVTITHERILVKKQDQLDELTAELEHLQKLEKMQRAQVDEQIQADEEEDWDDDKDSNKESDKDKDDDWDKDDEDWE